MKSTSNFSLSAAGGPDRQRVWRTPLLRYAALMLVAGVSSGCTERDVVMENPQTGKTEICRQSLQGLDPWSQTMACVSGHEAQGWIRASQE